MYRMTVPQALLLAAKTIDQPFHESKLVVAAWGSNRKMFGLRHYTDMYPDNNKVRACLIGKKGLIARGYLRKIAPMTYELTNFGLEVFNGENLKAITVNKTDVAEIDRMRKTKTFSRFLAGTRSAMSLRDAQEFWNGLADNTLRLLKRVRQILEAKSDLPTGNGGYISEELINKLVECNEYLMRKFKGVQ